MPPNIFHGKLLSGLALRLAGTGRENLWLVSVDCNLVREIIAEKWNSGQQQLDMGQSIQGWSK